jgi:hypothetical protein
MCRLVCASISPGPATDTGGDGGLVANFRTSLRLNFWVYVYAVAADERERAELAAVFERAAVAERAERAATDVPSAGRRPDMSRLSFGFPAVGHTATSVSCPAAQAAVAAESVVDAGRAAGAHRGRAAWMDDEEPADLPPVAAA